MTYYTASNTIAGNMTFDIPTVTVSESVQYVEIPVLREFGTDGVCTVAVQLDPVDNLKERAEYGHPADSVGTILPLH